MNHEEQQAYAFLELQGGNLELIQTLNASFVRPKIEPPYCPHFALGTEDLSKVLDMVRAKGIEVVKGPLEIPGQEKWLCISDPDHNVVEYIEWISNSS